MDHLEVSFIQPELNRLAVHFTEGKRTATFFQTTDLRFLAVSCKTNKQKKIYLDIWQHHTLKHIS